MKLLGATLIAALALLPPQAAEQSGRDLQETLAFGGRDRSYRVFVPDGIGAKGPAPAVVLFNGSGSSVEPLMKYWKDLARRDGIVLIGPGAFEPGAWRIPEDSPDFTGEVIETVKARFPIDPRRVYLFGHSGGAGHVLLLGLFESEYFAAVAAHAGALRGEDAQFLDLPKRKIAMAIWIGTKDRLVPLPVVRATYDTLTARDFPIKLTEIKDHTHAFSERGEEVTAKAWEFLRREHLSTDPKFYRYRFNPRPH
jgi:poly(3-hydroxybutyrate) depolymerase